MFKPYLITTTHQKVLDFFITHPEQSFYGAELAKKVSLSAGGINKVLKELERDGIIEKNRRGKTDFYSLKDNQPILHQLKILSNLLRIEPLVEDLKPFAHRIILYGSNANGTNDQQSDIDLLVVTTNANKSIIEEKINSYQKANVDLPKIQAAIKNTIQWTSLEDKDPTYFKEILKGINLWDRLKSYDENKERF
jgi:predicted nucleotidyltransferase